MSAPIALNVIVSGNSVSGAIDVNHTRFIMTLGNSDKVGTL